MGLNFRRCDSVDPPSWRVWSAADTVLLETTFILDHINFIPR